MGIPSIIVINHLANLSRIIPEIPEPPRKVVRLIVLFMDLVAEPSSEQSEALADILAVGMDERKGRDNSKLYDCISTAKPAAGKAMRLRSFSFLLMAYLNLSSWLLLRAH